MDDSSLLLNNAIRAALMKWMGKMNSSLAILEGGDNAQGTGEMVSDLDLDLTVTVTY